MMKHTLISHLFLFTFLFLSVLTGCQDRFYSMEDFKSVEKIDAHTHINVADPALLEQAREDNIRLMAINVDAPGYPPIEEQQEVALSLQQEFPQRLSYITTISLEGWNDPEAWQEQTIKYLDESFKKGAIGVKVWKNIGMEFRNEEGEFVMIDNPQFDPIFDYIRDRGKPVLGHIGEPKNCWLPLDEMTTNNDREYFSEHPRYHMYKHPDYPSYETIIKSRDNMLDKHPDLTFIGAHLGSMEWSLDMMAEHLDKYPNMALDMAHRVPHLQYLTQQDREAVREFFIKYQDRLVYSTDLQIDESSDPTEIKDLAHRSWEEQWQYFVTDDTLSVWEVEGSFRGLKLPRTVVDKIYKTNPEKWYPGI